MLDWILEALAQAGFERRDVVFICGYAEQAVRERYPEFTFVRNADWEDNNILLSLMYAREHLKDGFISTYADIVYDGEVVRGLRDSPHAISLGCDTAWRRRYEARTQHPESDAEKLRAKGSRVIEISRHIASEQAQGEFIGVMKLTKTGTEQLLDSFDAAQRQYSGRIFREGRTFQRAYLIDLLQQMLEAGIEMHRVDTNGGYMEVDTLQDLGLAARWWQHRP